MARKKQPTKAKEAVKIRFKKLANGNQSIFLDIYEGDGKPRVRQYLRLYIVPEVDTAAKIDNKNAMQAANAIKAQKILELANGKAGIETSARAKMLFVDWLREYQSIKEQTRRYGGVIPTAIKYVEGYKGGNQTMAQINKSYLVGFFEYLRGVKVRGGATIGSNSQYNVYLVISGALNMAVQKEIIPYNPLSKLAYDEKPHPVESDRPYLTVDEVKALINGKCRNEATKRAFLFACFCGFRYGDIEALTWGQITKDGDKYRATIKMQKSGRPLHQLLSGAALQWLPERGGAMDDDKVFDLPHKTNVERALDVWAAASGIDKHLTFHVSRHTFATLNLTAGVDIYTTSKLLGHTNVKTTQIYAKIVDKKKDEAIDAVSNLFL